MWRWAVLIAAYGVIFAASPALAVEAGQCISMSDMNAAMRSEGQRSLIVGDWVDYDGQLLSIGDTTHTRAEWTRISSDVKFDSPYRRDLIATLRTKGRSQAHIDDFIAKLHDVSDILAKGDPSLPIPRHMMIFAANANRSVGYIIVGDRPANEVSSQACVRAKFANVRLAGSSAESDVLAARGDIFQINGTKLSDLPIILRGSLSSGSAKVVADQPGNQPLYVLENVKLRPGASQ